MATALLASAKSGLVARPQRAQSRAAVRLQRRSVVRCAGPEGGNLPAELSTAIDGFVNQNKVALFIKGTRESPKCGFSKTVVQVGSRVTHCSIHTAIHAKEWHNLQHLAKVGLMSLVAPGAGRSSTRLEPPTRQ